MKHASCIVWTALALASVLSAAPAPAWAKGVPVEAATKSQMEEAVRQYRLGVSLLEAGKLEEALQMFQRSFDGVASPNSRLMIARTFAKLERYPDAYRELVATIDDARELAPAVVKYEKTIESAQAELVDVSAKVSLLKLAVDGKVTVNGQPIEPARWQEVHPMPPGEISLVYELSNGQRVEKPVVLSAGSMTTVDLRTPAASGAPLPAAAEPPAELSARSDSVSYETLGWVSAGVGAGGLLAFSVFGLLNNGQFNDLKDDCPKNRCAEGKSDDAETGRTYQSLANVGLGVGLVGGLSAAYFLFFSKHGFGAEASAKSEQVSVSETELLVGPSGVSVRGQF